MNDAYVAIKAKRREIVHEYVDELLELADECAANELAGAGKELTDLALRVTSPPKHRRKTRQRAVGVAVDQEGELEVELVEVEQKNLSPEDLARLEAVRERVAKVRTALGIEDAAGGDEGGIDPAGTGEDAGGAPPPQEKETDDKADARKKASLEKRIYSKEKSARGRLLREVEKLVKTCAAKGFPAHAYEVLLWAIDLDPDNRSLRRIVRQLAYTDPLSGDKLWYSPYEISKAKQGYLQHPEYGWVKPVELKALKAGKLWYKGEWQDKDFVDRERQKWENAWEYETEHFVIHTNAPLRDVVIFGREVERLYAFFFRTFIDFYAPENRRMAEEIVFSGGMKLSKKLQLHYYRSREHYIAEVKKDPELANAPGIELVARSAGFYWKGSHKAYFYRGPTGPDLSVIYHEVTHQIFGETYDTGPRPPTWLVEGFGVFMEDPVLRGERLLAGAEPPPGLNTESPRDLDEFVRNYQNHDSFHGPLRGDNYATAGAAVHFFLFFKGGILRQGFMRYAREAYRNSQDDSPTAIDKLYEYLGVSPTELESHWEEFNRQPDLFDF